jgi:predicted ATPase
LDALPAYDRNRPAAWPGCIEKRPRVVEAIIRFTNMEPQQRRRHTFEMLKRLLIHESQKQPLLLVFEDLHWIDNETQAFLDTLVESLPMARTLLLVNYRPGYSHAWADKTYYTRIRVDPLTSTGADELLQYLLGSNKDLAPLKELLIKRTEGNPFFAEESVRSLVETGILIGAKGAYRPGLQIETIRMPSTVQSILAGRIDRLPLEEKRLLQIAAVIGVIIPLPLLRAVAELAEDDLQRCLAHLQAAEFLYETSLFPDLEYTFKHALTNEVAYRALLHERRTALHARIVGALERMGGEVSHDHVEKLAHHAFHGELWAKSVPYLRQAAAKAMARSANLEAVVLLERALDALEHLPDNRDKLDTAIDLRLELRNPLFLLGQFERLYSDLRKAESLAEASGDRSKLGRVLNFLIAYFGLVGEHEHAIAAGQRALNLNRDSLELSIVTSYYMGLTCHHMGRYDQSVEIFNRVLTSVGDRSHRYDRFGTANIISVISRVWLVQCLAELGAFSEGLHHAEEAIQIAKEADHPYSLAYAHCSLGFLHLLRGNFERAITLLETCHSICEAYDIKVLLTHVGSHLGCAYALSNRVAEALPLLEKSDEQSALIGRKAGQSLRLTWHGQASLLAGEIEDAKKFADRALSLSVEAKERGYQAWALKLLGDIAIHKKSVEAERSNEYYRQALTLADELGMRPLKAHCHLGLSALCIQKGRRDLACTELAAAIALYRDMEMTFWLTQAEARLETLAP